MLARLSVLIAADQEKERPAMRHFRAAEQRVVGSVLARFAVRAKWRLHENPIGIEQHLGQRVLLGDTLVRSTSVTLRHLFDTHAEVPANVLRETHPLKAVWDVSATAVQVAI